ncbi:hypothetical protein AHF37_04604 [Paragonimus kellicotti]|nr:hypothetical protein AHF37_04604 [Paragonimus kellicotti]
MLWLSSPGSTLPDISVASVERNVVDSTNQTKHFKRYASSIVVITNNSADVTQFLVALNPAYPNMKQTLGEEHFDEVSFLSFQLIGQSVESRQLLVSTGTHTIFRPTAYKVDLAHILVPRSKLICTSDKLQGKIGNHSQASAMTSIFDTPIHNPLTPVMLNLSDDATSPHASLSQREDGSPGSTLPDISVASVERNVVDSTNQTKHFKRYASSIVVITNNSADVTQFLVALNPAYPNMKQTLGEEHFDEVSFLSFQLIGQSVESRQLLVSTGTHTIFRPTAYKVDLAHILVPRSKLICTSDKLQGKVSFLCAL